MNYNWLNRPSMCPHTRVFTQFPVPYTGIETSRAKNKDNKS